MNSTLIPQPDGLDRRGILITLIIGTLMAAIDSSIVNVSLPAMIRTLGARVDEIGWVVTAYLIAFALVMPATQWLKNRWGFFALYFASLVVFTLGSLLCGFAPTLSWLVIARVLQGLGGGALTPTAMSILSTIYPPHERGKVLGLWGLGVVLGPAFGPTLGGVLTQYFGWPSIFLVNIPVGIVGLFASWKYLRPLPSIKSPALPFDWIGFGALSFFLIALLFGIGRLEGAAQRFADSYFCFALAVFFLVIFVQYEKRTLHPMVDLNIFRSKSLVACLSVTFSRTAGLYGGIFLLPFLLQGLLGYSETAAGLIMFPGSLLVAILMPLAGHWADRRGPRGICILGIGLLAVSMAAFAMLGVGSTLWGIFLAMGIRGVGLGFLITPISVATVNCAEPKDVALVSSVSSLVQQIGGAIGVASLAVFHELLRHRSLLAGSSERLAEQTAVRAGFAAAGVMTALALLPALFIPSRIERPAAAEAVAFEA